MPARRLPQSMPQEYEMGAASRTNVSDEVALADNLAFQVAIDEVAANENWGRMRIRPSVRELKEYQQVRKPMIQLRENTCLLLDDEAWIRRKGG